MKRNTECTGKTKHSTKEGACVEADKIKNVGINVYKCSKCGSWHIGKTRDPARSANRISKLLKQSSLELERRIDKLKKHYEGKTGTN